jgi:oligopeptidase B
MTESTPKPPIAAVRPHKVESAHGTRIDPYYWLRDDERKDPEVLAYIGAENAYRSAVMAPTEALQEALYTEIVARLKQDDSTVPYRKNGYWYSVRYATGQEHPIFVRRADTVQAPEEILLDANAMAAGQHYFQIGAMAVSPNGATLAFCEDSVGRRQYTLRFKNLLTGEFFDERIDNVEPDLVWAADNRTVMYVEKEPETLLGIYVKKHRLGTSVREDALLFEQTNLSFYTGIGKSKSDAYLFIHMQSTLSSEWLYARADDPELRFEVFLARESDHEYDLEHAGECFLVRSNWRAQNFRLAAAPIEPHSDRSRWHDVVAHRTEVLIEDFEPFDDFIALSVRSGGLSKIAIKHWQKNDPRAPGREHFIDSEETAYSMGVSVNPEMSSHTLRYVYSSLTTPTSVYDYDVRSGARQLLKRDPVLGDFDPHRYATEFIFVTARDGTAVPVSLVYAKTFRRDGSAPLLQYAYGAYGISLEPSFSSSRLSLLDRGFVYAIAHVRGGQEMGRAWYDTGRWLHKRNSFTDFIDVTQALVAQGYAAGNKIFAMGGSAGGLLMGAVANMGAAHYRGVVAQVPFVDVLTTMLDDTIPLTSNEYEEWGNPNKARDYEYMKSYSPYDNVSAQAYPAMLITTGLWDSQVQYYEPVKWAAKLRAHKTDEQVLLLHVEMEAGHGGKSGRFQRYREIAMEYAFVLDQAGIHK